MSTRALYAPVRPQGGDRKFPTSPEPSSGSGGNRIHPTAPLFCSAGSGRPSADPGSIPFRFDLFIEFHPFSTLDSNLGWGGVSVMLAQRGPRRNEGTISSGIPGRYPHLPRLFLNPCNLPSRQAQDYPRSDQNGSFENSLRVPETVPWCLHFHDSPVCS